MKYSTREMIVSYFVWDEEKEEIVGEVMEVWEGFRAWTWRDGDRDRRLGLHRSAYMAERDIAAWWGMKSWITEGENE